MKVSIYFLPAALLAGCANTTPPADVSPQAVRTVAARQGAVVEGRRYLAEVVPERTVRVLAQVPGAVAELSVAEGLAVAAGTSLLRIAAPDVSARVARVGAERARAERERDFACKQLDTDRVLAAAGDLAPVQLDLSEKGCASAGLAADAARAAEWEVGDAGARAEERAPFDGEVLMQLVDVGQTVMPGTPLLQFGSRERLLRLRVPERDLADVSVGTRLESASGAGQVTEIGAQASGPGRLVELLVAMDEPVALRPGTTLTASLVVSERASTSSVPESALVEGPEAIYVLVVEGESLRRVNVVLGPRQDGWVAVEPPLPEGTRVVSGVSSSLDLSRPVLAVAP